MALLGNLILTFTTLIGGACIIGYILIRIRSHELRLRDKTNVNNYVRDYLMLSWVDKDTGTEWWKSVPWQPKLKIPAPPNEVIDIGKRGRKYAEAHRINDEQVVWVKDAGLTGEKSDEIMQSFQPFSATQREVLLASFIKAAEKRKKKFLSPEFVLPALSILSFTILIIALMVFYGDIAAPSLESHRLASKHIEMAQSIQQTNIRIMQAIGLRAGANFTQTPDVQAGSPVIETADETPPEVPDK